MQKICTKGYKISSQDQKIWDHYMIETPEQWTQKALNGMINKAKKLILRRDLKSYKEQNPGDISADYSVLISAIVAMEGFQSFKIESDEKRIADRKTDRTREVWPNGFQIEDWQWAALQAYYKDPEVFLYDRMENKIALRKAAFLKEGEAICLKDSSITKIPAHADDMADLICARAGYKNRAQLEGQQ